MTIGSVINISFEFSCSDGYLMLTITKYTQRYSINFTPWWEIFYAYFQTFSKQYIYIFQIWLIKTFVSTSRCFFDPRCIFFLYFFFTFFWWLLLITTNSCSFKRYFLKIRFLIKNSTNYQTIIIINLKCISTCFELLSLKFSD